MCRCTGTELGNSVAGGVVPLRQGCPIRTSGEGELGDFIRAFLTGKP